MFIEFTCLLEALPISRAFSSIWWLAGGQVIRLFSFGGSRPGWACASHGGVRSGKKQAAICKVSKVLSQQCPATSELLCWPKKVLWWIPRTEEPSGVQFLGLQRVRHDWATNTMTFTFVTSPKLLIPPKKTGTLLFVDTLNHLILFHFWITSWKEKVDHLRTVTFDLNQPSIEKRCPGLGNLRTNLPLGFSCPLAFQTIISK